ncbi:hypothetical protein CPF_0196 [Clostridium perfringens ATCC 13124]|uniref:Uncharacterized protein n=1 Tax=Clostridium perfringens (strain ATCC 13124 / DSM 756 / JCM 1290 / NCIMB 6125 / NCTC 8237 / Type A) TaxID=195103 RepID=A0A0H2YTT0_CLOP1|nr:hypothetical protein CPF_0196 [Clostridium perfringens ATCC 13124]
MFLEFQFSLVESLKANLGCSILINYSNDLLNFIKVKLFRSVVFGDSNFFI